MCVVCSASTLIAAHPHLLSFWLQTHGSTHPIFSSGQTLMAAYSSSFLLSKHSWQHTLISFLLGKHSWQHIPSPFFWVHTNGSTLHLLSSGQTLKATHSISLLLGPHSWQHTHPRFGSTSVEAHQFLCLNERTFLLLQVVA